MIYPREDFEKMDWDIFSIPVGNKVTTAFPELKKIFLGMLGRIRTNELTDNRIIRYIIYVYHRKSPLLRETNLITRKQQAMMLCGMKLDDRGFFGKAVNLVIAGKQVKVNDMTLRFLKYENSIDYMAYCYHLDAYFSIMRALGTHEGNLKDDDDPIAQAKQKGAIMAELSKMKKEIRSLAKDLFVDDNDLENYVGSFEVSEKTEYKISPEQYAR